MEDKFEPRSDVFIEGNVAKWSIALHGAIGGTYAGDFVFRCILTPSQQIAANRDYREMLGANPTLAPEHESFLAYALTQLKYRVVSAPPFWESTRQANGIAGDIPDQDVIEAVLDAAVHAQLKYRYELNQKKLELIERAKAAAERIINGRKDEEDDLEVDEVEDI
jgi:hypothetical protein